jgi:peptidyl-prolyl cis-trans isomerase SurA
MKPPRVVLPSLVLLGGAFAALLHADILERVVVRVNADIVTQSEFEARQIAAVQQARIPAGQVEAYLRENNARLLQEAIDDLLLTQRAAALGIRVPASYLNQVLESIRKENNIESEAELVRQLRSENMSLADLRRNIERSAVRQEVLRSELQGKVKVTEAEARAQYEKDKATYVRAATVHLLEVVLPPAATRAQAEEVVRRARAGEDFGALARAESVGTTREEGGDLGNLSKGDLAPALEAVAFGLATGAVSDPVEVEGGGYRILKVQDRTEGHVVPFAEVKDQILDRLRQTRAAERYEAYLEGLRKDAVIELKVREVPLSVEVPPETGAGPSLAAPRLGAPAAPGDDEFSVTPQAAPERVAPPPAPAAAPTPSPSPQGP